MSCSKISLAIVLFLALPACSDSDNGSGIETANTSSMVTLEATVREPSELGGTIGESDVRIDYTVTNISSLELIIFDVGTMTTTGIDEDGRITLFQAKRDTGATAFESRPTIAGRNISPNQTLNGSANRNLPIRIDFVGSLEEFDPESIRLCLGFGNADDIIPTTLSDGTFTLNQNLDLQSLTCTDVSLP